MTNPSSSYREVAPPSAIAHLIGAFWHFSAPDFTGESNSLIQHLVLPDGCMDIIFQYQRSSNGGMNNPQLTFYGSTDRFNLFAIKPSTEFVGIRDSDRLHCVTVYPPVRFLQDKAGSLRNNANYSSTLPR